MLIYHFQLKNSVPSRPQWIIFDLLIFQFLSPRQKKSVHGNAMHRIKTGNSYFLVSSAHNSNNHIHETSTLVVFLFAKWKSHGFKKKIENDNNNHSEARTKPFRWIEGKRTNKIVIIQFHRGAKRSAIVDDWIVSETILKKSIWLD